MIREEKSNLPLDNPGEADGPLVQVHLQAAAAEELPGGVPQLHLGSLPGEESDRRAGAGPVAQPEMDQRVDLRENQLKTRLFDEGSPTVIFSEDISSFGQR